MKDGLHIYPATHEHDEVNIVGTHEALCKLRDALTAAIDRNSAKKQGFIANDGEGFWVCIAPVDPGTFESMAEHYAYPRASAEGFKLIGTWPGDLKIDWARA